MVCNILISLFFVKIELEFTGTVIKSVGNVEIKIFKAFIHKNRKFTKSV